ncbi:DUF547 domain-containing protein [Aquimarina sp. AU474]|uniref:DUF547 domain-containing protein n=1 Tax=Aquimarina sp. AU474 TaxID=2108529 RepID=UPI001F3A2F80|nr:DUF547 domain-containing protein [Aquimarina sp. AU474]
MNKVLVILFIWSSFACSGSKAAVQTSQDSMIMEQKDSSKKIDSIKPNIPIEEKAPETPTEQLVLKQENTEKEQVIDSTQKESKIKNNEKVAPNIAVFDHKPWDILLSKNVQKDGTINYKAFKQNRTAFRAYLNALGKNTPKENWSKQDKLAYWLNVYNAFTVKLIIDNYPIKSIKDIKEPWDLRFFKLGNKWYTLNDVEHRILRKMNDPRIHFGINCASYSCPPLLNKAFTAKNVNQELDKLAIAFINDPKRNTISANNIVLSKIFLWFAKDFKKQGSLIKFLNKYSKIKIKTNAKKTYKKYNWALNE